MNRDAPRCESGGGKVLRETSLQGVNKAYLRGKIHERH